MIATEDRTDLIETRCGAVIQHGPLNERIYVMKVGEASPHRLIAELDALARTRGYSKIFAKVPASRAAAFLEAGYVQEAAVESFFADGDDARFLCAYPDPNRAFEQDADTLDKVKAAARAKWQRGPGSKPIPDGALLRECTPQDVTAMANLYETVFPSYPFPIHDPDYLCRTMHTHVRYFCVDLRGELVALSSAEMDRQERNVEMTDFATHPDQRGQGLAVRLLRHMETAMRESNFKTAYTIARAASYGMNITFGRLGYHYGGRLKNNTNISGRIESMNVWYKGLQPE